MNSKASTTTSPTPGWIVVGHIEGTHNLKGGMKVKVSEALPDWAQEGFPLKLVVEQGPLHAQHPHGWDVTVAKVQALGTKRLALYVAGVNTIEAAQAWHGAHILVEEAALPTPEAGLYRLGQLIGLPVTTQESSKCWGTATQMLSATRPGAAGQDMDFLEVTFTHSGKTVMIPFHAPFVGPVVLASEAPDGVGSITLVGLEEFLAEEDVLKEVKTKKPTPYQRKKQKKAAPEASPEA
jgi:ribosomal 30S subunit maturation factor RimM